MLQWKELHMECEKCNKCILGEARTNMVFGEGNIRSKLMFIGEAPGADEDRTGKPFVGRAGQLLTKGLTALNLNRDRDYYICNVCKCRPEGNRTPKEEEAEACISFLRNQVALISPRIIVCLGAIAMKYVMESAIKRAIIKGEAIEVFSHTNNSLKFSIESKQFKEMKITRDRGVFIKIKNFYIMATFHPAALFRDESKKQLFWEDLKKVKEKLMEI